MGSGHFLTNAVDYLAREIIDAQEKQAAQQGVETVDETYDINWARRKIAQRCIYGVDLNPLATELAKVSLWLRTLAAEQPLAFLDHHLKTGNSLVGSDIEDILGDDEGETESGQLTLQQSFAHTRQQALEHVMERFQDLLSIDNETLEDAKEMEVMYDEVREDPLYQHLLAMANVHTAEQFGLDVPDNAYERMAEALRDDSWAKIEEQNWFKSAQVMADDEQSFHWELEFPVAFYGVDGTRKADAGFDAIVGNPPYGASFSESQEMYLRAQYPNQDYQLDTYLLFIEQGIGMTRDGGEFGMIVPNTWLSNLKLRSIRKLLIGEKTIRTIRYYQKSVFEGVTVDTLALIARNQTFGKNHNVAVELDDGHLTEYQIPQKRWANQDGNAINILERPEIISISDKLRNNPHLGEFCDVTQGTKPFQVGKGTPEQTREIVDEKPYVSNDKESEDFRPLLSGKHVQRYVVDWNQNYWIKLGDWLAEPRYSASYDAPLKILIRQTADSLIATLDTKQFVVRDNLYTVVCDCEFDFRYLLSLLNSKLLNWYYQQVMNPEKGEALAQVKRGHIAKLPIHHERLRRSTIEITSLDTDALQILDGDVAKTVDVHEILCKLVDQMLRVEDRRRSLNLNLVDYLGNYHEGPRLPDVGLFQPVSSNILNATIEDYEKLRVGDVNIERDGRSVTIYATARYKPEDEDMFETDRWGYTETGYKEAFTLTDLSEEEATLVEAFVPVAVEKGDGFAGFRDNATKTNSPINRLKAITLPNLDNISDDFQRYLNTKTRADELDEKLEKTDKLIDGIVYDLYNLTDKEIEIVESSV